jgi:hypothetical protein
LDSKWTCASTCIDGGFSHLPQDTGSTTRAEPWSSVTVTVTSELPDSGETIRLSELVASQESAAVHSPASDAKAWAGDTPSEVCSSQPTGLVSLHETPLPV